MRLCLLAFGLVACVSAKNERTDTAVTTDGESTAARTGDTSTTGSPSVCAWDQPESTCEAQAGCLYRSATALDDACVASDDAAGWCVATPTGHSDAPSLWFEVESGRVFAFAVTPFDAPAGWERCQCESLAAACRCDDACTAATSTSPD